ncbi:MULTISPECIES: hypothetical protein [Streptomyces]|uniref:Uncharacterized protein n=2 Tax=Streptomyces TaxID=1883 RepID=A0ABV9J8Q5_9ACTN
MASRPPKPESAMDEDVPEAATARWMGGSPDHSAGLRTGGISPAPATAPESAGTSAAGT